MAKPRTIYCPMCHRRVAQWDGKSTINPVIGNCKNCNKRVVYDLVSEEVTVKNLPIRATSSGMRFY